MDGVDNQRAGAAEILAQERLNTAADLVDLQCALAQDPDVEEIGKRLDGLIQRIAVKAS